MRWLLDSGEGSTMKMTGKCLRCADREVVIRIGDDCLCEDCLNRFFQYAKHTQQDGIMKLWARYADACRQIARRNAMGTPQPAKVLPGQNWSTGTADPSAL